MLLRDGSRRDKVRFGLKIADARNMPGALVGAVGAGGLGSRAGLASGDVVTEISGLPVRNAGDMERILAGIRTGDIVALRFSRGGVDRKSEIVAA
jgi:S1-C subfamily serine protease